MKELTEKKENTVQIYEVDKKWNELRDLIKQVKNPITKKLLQAVMVPLAIFIDYMKFKNKKDKL
jgi:hypothetical protein